MKKTRSRFGADAALAACLLIVLGCAEVTVETQGFKGDPAALTIPASKPYLLVERRADGVGMALRIVHLPDPTRNYRVTVRKWPAWWRGGANFRAELTQDGFLRSITAGASGSSPEPSAGVVQELATALATSSGNNGDFPSPKVGLYALEFDKDSLKSIHHVEFDDLQQSAAKRFSPDADDTEALAPGAEISFATDSQGRITSIAIRYDPRHGSCIPAENPGAVQVQEAGRNLDVAWENQLFGKTCVAARLGLLDPPRSDVAVLVVPHNQSDLWGKPVFASAAAPAPPVKPEPVPPAVVNLTTPPASVQVVYPPPQTLVYDKDKNSFNFVLGAPGPTALPLPCYPCQPFPPGKDKLTKPELMKVKAEVDETKRTLKDLDVWFTADPRWVSGRLTAAVVPYKPTSSKALIKAITLNPSTECEIESDVPTASLKSLTLEDEKTHRFRAKISLNKGEKTTNFDVQLKFTDDKSPCIRFTIDQKLLPLKKELTQ
ncbi:MAG TPA: hypothetical protein VGS07_24985 [Thermoanaerobaculia bacterium]|jgi:hypothetical protein|nr:hypothetical protein [Thermoanaerobaculia bacterium]